MRRFFKVLKDEKGVGVVEIILILVARLALSMSIWFKAPFYQGLRADYEENPKETEKKDCEKSFVIHS